MVGAGVGVAQGSGGHRARWVTVEEAWVLEADFESETFVLPNGESFTGREGEPPSSEEELPPAGSAVYFTDAIYASAGAGFERGEQIGRDFGTCTLTVDAALCHVHTRIDERGTIEAQFAFAFDQEEPQPGEPIAAAIVGGTGEFRGISGQVLVYDADDETDPTDTLERIELDAVVPNHHR